MRITIRDRPSYKLWNGSEISNLRLQQLWPVSIIYSLIHGFANESVEFRSYLLRCIFLLFTNPANFLLVEPKVKFLYRCGLVTPNKKFSIRKEAKKRKKKKKKWKKERRKMEKNGEKRRRFDHEGKEFLRLIRRTRGRTLGIGIDSINRPDLIRINQACFQLTVEENCRTASGWGERCGGPSSG